jgi:hypothetical protein
VTVAGKSPVGNIECHPFLPDDILCNARAVVEYRKTLGGHDRGFKRSIVALQSPEVSEVAEGASLLVWDVEGALLRPALSDIMSVPVLPNNWAYRPNERLRLEARIQNGLSVLSELYPGIFEAFCATVTHLVFARCAGYTGGSISKRIGIIWLAPEAHWSTVFVAENVLHEFLHQALFLDEMVNGMFIGGAEQLNQDDALTISAVRRTRRGYDKAFHSAFVAYGLIRFYQRAGDSDHARDMVSPLLVCLDDLVDKRRMLTPHGEALLADLVGHCLRTACELQ